MFCPRVSTPMVYLGSGIRYVVTSKSLIVVLYFDLNIILLD